MNALSALCLPILLGFLALSRLLRTVALRHKGLFLLSAAFPTGAGIFSLILFVSVLISPTHAKHISLITSMVSLLLLVADSIRLHFKQPSACNRSLKTQSLLPPPMNRSLTNNLWTAAAFLLFVYTAATILDFYFLSAATNLPGGWDARYFWSLKAKFMFRSPADWQLLFSPKLPWSNPAYPLLWPSTLVMGWEWLGRESMIWASFASFSFYISCVLLLAWYLSAHHSPATGWFAGAFFMVLTPPLFWALQQYADVPVTFFMTACSFLLITALRSENTRFLIIAGLMGGLAAWTKNEGALFLMWIYGVLGISLAFQKKETGGNILKGLRDFSLGALGPVTALLLLKYLAKEPSAFVTLPDQNIASLSDFFTSGWGQMGTITKSFFDYMNSFGAWKGLWGFFLLAILFAMTKRPPLKPYGNTLLLLVLLINAGYFAVLMATSPAHLGWQIRTALERLLIHSSLLATAFTFETLSFPHDSSCK